MLNQGQNLPTKVLNSKRYLVKDIQGRNIYLTICDCPFVGTPLELWITLPDENKDSEQVLKTDIVTMVTLFTEAREAGAKYTKILDAMERVCYSKKATTYQILELLRIHCPRNKASDLEFEFASEKRDVKLQ